MFIGSEWEMFYTHSKNNEDLVDQISINTKKKRFILDIDISNLATDGYDDADDPIDSIYISREMFEIIVLGIKQKNYKEYIPCE